MKHSHHTHLYKVTLLALTILLLTPLTTALGVTPGRKVPKGHARPSKLTTPLATLLPLTLLITLLITQPIRTEITALLSIATLTITGLLTPEEAISGFSSSATVTVAGMFILSAGMIRTGALDTAITLVLRFARESTRRLFALLTALVPTLSAFANNTPIVVMMIPITLTICRRLAISPSKLLLNF